MYAKCCTTNVDEFMSECIHYNINIVRDKRIIFIKEWFENDIFFIAHLVDFSGNFPCFDKFKIKFPAVTRTHFLMYEGDIQAILEYQKSKEVLSMDHFKRFDAKA